MITRRTRIGHTFKLTRILYSMYKHEEQPYTAANVTDTSQ